MNFILVGSLYTVELCSSRQIRLEEYVEMSFFACLLQRWHQIPGSCQHRPHIGWTWLWPAVQRSEWRQEREYCKYWTAIQNRIELKFYIVELAQLQHHQVGTRIYMTLLHGFCHNEELLSSTVMQRYNYFVDLLLCPWWWYQWSELFCRSSQDHWTSSRLGHWSLATQWECKIVIESQMTSTTCSGSLN